MTPADADKLIFARIRATPSVGLPLAECWGAVLTDAVSADRAQPPADRVLVDGIALAGAALISGARSFRRQGLQAAGEPPLRLVSADHCIEVTTGAVLPDGCNTVAPLEVIEVVGARVTISPRWLPSPDANVQRRGAEALAGQELLSPGVVLRAPEIAAAAAVGCGVLMVRRPARVQLLSVGTELMSIDAPVEPWQVRRATMAAVSATLRRHGIPEIDSDHVDDDPEQLRERISVALVGVDVLVVCGATGHGAHDFLAAVLAAVGVLPVVTGVNQRPGGSMWFGVGPRGQLVFALPGSLPATLACLVRYVVPTLCRMTGHRSVEPTSVALADGLPVGGPTCRFIPVVLSREDAGIARAATRGPGRPGDVLSLLATDGIVEITSASGPIVAGTVVPFYSW